MHIPLPFHETTTTAAVSTGELPTLEVVAELLVEAFELYRSVDEGSVADYIPALANDRSGPLRGQHRWRRGQEFLGWGRRTPLLAAEHLQGVRVRLGLRRHRP